MRLIALSLGTALPVLAHLYEKRGWRGLVGGLGWERVGGGGGKTGESECMTRSAAQRGPWHYTHGMHISLSLFLPTNHARAQSTQRQGLYLPHTLHVAAALLVAPVVAPLDSHGACVGMGKEGETRRVRRHGYWYGGRGAPGGQAQVALPRVPQRQGRHTPTQGKRKKKARGGDGMKKKRRRQPHTLGTEPHHASAFLVAPAPTPYPLARAWDTATHPPATKSKGERGAGKRTKPSEATLGTTQRQGQDDG